MNELAQHLASNSPAAPAVPDLLRALAERVDIIEGERVRLRNVLETAQVPLSRVLAIVNEVLGSTDKSARPADGDPVKPHPLELEVERLKAECAAEREARELVQEECDTLKVRDLNYRRELKLAASELTQTRICLNEKNEIIAEAHRLLDPLGFGCGGFLNDRLSLLVIKFRALRDATPPATS